MSYQIHYEAEKNRKYPIRMKKKNVFGFLTYILIATALGLLLSFPSVRSFLIPGDPEVTSAAFSQLVDDVQAGDSLGDAVSTFCRDIINNAD